MPCTFWHKSSRVTWSASVAIVAAAGLPTGVAAQGQGPGQAPASVPAKTNVPETHTVREGDTLWDVAKKYFGDPFLWPDLYRRNTAVVEDPHWIYPGEVLRLSGADDVSAVPAKDTPAPANANGDKDAAADNAQTVAVADTSAHGPTGLPPVTAEDTAYTPLFSTPTRKVMEETLRAYAEQPRRPLRQSEFYSSGFLTEGKTLPFGQLLGPVTPSQIRTFSNRDVATLYTTVGIEPGRGTSYQVGDTLLVATLGGEIQGYGNVVVPAGLARVTEAAHGRYLASIVAVYGPLRRGQLVLPAEHFVPAPDSVRAQPVADGVRGHLLGGRGRQDLKTPQMVVFVDKGSRDGVAPGDVFEARRQPRRLPDGSLRVDEVMAQFQIVHVGERSATALVTGVLSPDIPPGTEARQVAKLR